MQIYVGKVKPLSLDLNQLGCVTVTVFFMFRNSDFYTRIRFRMVTTYHKNNLFTKECSTYDNYILDILKK